MLFFCVFLFYPPLPFFANLRNLRLLCPVVPLGALLFRQRLPLFCHLCHYLGWLHITQFLLYLWALLLGEQEIPGHPAILLGFTIYLLLLRRLLLLRLRWLLIKLCHHSRHLLLKLSNAVGNDLKGHRHLCFYIWLSVGTLLFILYIYFNFFYTIHKPSFF